MSGFTDTLNDRRDLAAVSEELLEKAVPSAATGHGAATTMHDLACRFETSARRARADAGMVDAGVTDKVWQAANHLTHETAALLELYRQVQRQTAVVRQHLAGLRGRAA